MYKKERLATLIMEMRYHWCLERINPTLWCVYDTETGDTLSGEMDPAEAIYSAIHSPLSQAASKYYPRYAWGMLSNGLMKLAGLGD